MKKLIIIFTAIVTTILCNNLSAQSSKSNWEIIATYEVPYEADFEITVENDGIIRHYLIVDNKKISVRESSYNLFKNKERGLILVEWYNKNTNKYKYTVRLDTPKDDNKKLTIHWNNE